VEYRLVGTGFGSQKRLSVIVAFGGGEGERIDEISIGAAARHAESLT
jgi:hypothetical protein